MFLLGQTAGSILAGPSRRLATLGSLAHARARTPLPFPRRRFSSSPTVIQRLGQITPKRIAIPLGADSGIVADGSLPKVSVWRPVIFCLLLGGGGYVAAALYTNAETETWVQRLGQGAWWRGTGVQRITDAEIMRAKKLDEAKEAQQMIDTIGSNIKLLPVAVRTFIIRTIAMYEEWELNTPPAKAVSLDIILVMSAIALSWKNPRLDPFMRKWFLHRPVVFSSSALKQWQASVTLFTSTLSHQTLPHIAFNSLALYSFGSAAYSFLSAPAPNTTPLLSSTYTPHFLAFLLCGGLFASLSSHLWTNLVRLPRLLRALRNPGRISSPQALAVQHGIMPGLGASGAVYAAVTLTALAFPETSVSLIFLPFFPIPIMTGVGAMVAMDVIGLIRGWRMLDHTAHLGGALFGVVYFFYGRQTWAWVRRQLRMEAGTKVA